ncbi:5336_t:CDS:2, partial [Funneliformis geosporum]
TYRSHQVVVILGRKNPFHRDPSKVLTIPSSGRDSWKKAIRSYRFHRTYRSHQVVVILGRKSSILIDPIANGRDSWKKLSVLIDPIKWS